MSKEKKQLKLNIKGKFRNFISQLFLSKKIKQLGVDVQEINNHSPEHVEILVSGEKAKLWEVIRWSKGQSIFIFLNEVIFEFADPVSVG